MIPICTVDEMRAADAVAVGRIGHDALISRAGYAVGQIVAERVSRIYGLRVVVIVGSGSNGADGRVAGAYLERRGAKVEYVSLPLEKIAHADVIIDAVVGVGVNRPLVMPIIPDDALVVAVDIPSGVNPDTGEVMGEPLVADVTVAMGALKYAHVLEPAAHFCGDVVVATLGIPAPMTCAMVDDDDLMDVIRSNRDDHKWHHALFVGAGSTSMSGAASLVCRAAAVCGASMIRLASPTPLGSEFQWPEEVVRDDTVEIDRRCRAVVVGPGIGRDAVAQKFADEVVRGARVPLVIDADALDRERVLTHRESAMVLTPHLGELTRLIDDIESSPIAAARRAARELGATVLLKGPVTVVAGSDGTTRIVTSGTPALASAGTGDVLSGVIGALLARGLDPIEAASLGAHLHGRAGALLAPYATASEMDGALRHILGELEHAS